VAVSQQSTTTSGDIQNGPNIDTVVYKHVDSDRWTYSILNNEIDLIVGSFSPEELTFLYTDPSIELYTQPGNGYWCIDINCLYSPMNYSSFRRAFAYAFDKTRVTTEIFGNFSQPHDSIVPHANSFCIEEELDCHYYTNQAQIGNQILDEAGFEIDPGTGYRNDPNGNPFVIDVGYYSHQRHFSERIARIADDALSDLHIYAYPILTAPPIPSLYPRSQPDMIVHSVWFNGNKVDWLGNEYWGEYTDVDEVYWYPRYFSNATYDMYREDLLSESSFISVYNAAAQIQRLIHYDVPRLVVCPKLILHPYRTDTFTGLIEDMTRGVSGVWSLCNMYNRTGSLGGTVRVGIVGPMEGFNIYTTNSYKSRLIFENIWPTLFTIGPNLEFIPNLAKNMMSETHADNPDVPEGHVRLTIDIIQNATWSDGVPLTAEDVAFTHSYEIESGVFGNPAAQDLTELVFAVAPTLYRVIIEYNTMSYWHKFNEAFRYIIPKHIFAPGGIGYEGWEGWNPVFDSEEPYVTCGPFIMDKWEELEFEMVRNPNYHYSASFMPEIKQGSPTETTQPFATGLQPLTPSPLQLITMSISIGSFAIIVDSIVRIIRHKQSDKS
jgi:ABC-type transport system substrate-binding protein